MRAVYVEEIQQAKPLFDRMINRSSVSTRAGSDPLEPFTAQTNPYSTSGV